MVWRRVLALSLGLSGFSAAEITYTRDIAAILQQKCQQCHRPHDIGPMPLDSYEAAYDFREDIKLAISTGKMPPWKPVPGHGAFRGDFSLTDEERWKIVEWVDTGAPKGEDSDLPEAPAPEGEWVLGEPDLVVQMAEPYTPPRGKDTYRCFVIPTGNPEQRFVSAVDLAPGDRRSVHHVVLFIDTSGTAERLDQGDEEPGYDCFGGPGIPIEQMAFQAILGNGVTLGGWAPGARARFLPDGIGMHLPANARIVMQVHYYPRGLVVDQTKIGLYFNKTQVEKRLNWIPLAPTNLTIPAGAEKHSVNTGLIVPPLLDFHVVQIFPHMHLLGTEVRADLIQPGKDPQPMIYIDKWDFNWQGPYTFVDAVTVPAFSRIQVTCTYNNSESNPRNPNNPVKTVRWGDRTEDEMCVMFMGVTFDRERLN